MRQMGAISMGLFRAESLVALPAARDSLYEGLLARRRSLREFANSALTLQELARLLWAAQGVSQPRGLRTAPSAGALYPLELYAVVGQVEGLVAGVYHYRPDRHALCKRKDGDLRGALATAALGQRWVAEGAVVLAIAAVYRRTTRKYGERGIRYVHQESGHAAQNVCLQATVLGLGTVTVGAFDERAVQRVLMWPAEQVPLYLLPVGRPLA